MSDDRFAMAPLTGGQMNALVKLHGGADAVLRLLRGETEITISEKQKPKLLSAVATIMLGAVAGKKTAKCFTGSWWGYRDGDFDNSLMTEQLGADTCTIVTCTFARAWTFREAAEALPGVEAGRDVVELGNRLIALGYTMTLVQAENMVGRTENDEPTGMRTDGYGNFFFVETGDPKNPVSVGGVDRYERWYAHLARLGDVDRWCAGYRLLLRNLDASKL